MRILARPWLRIAALALTTASATACRAEAPAATESTAPALALTGRVVDAANVLPPEVESALDERSAKLEEATGVQFVVVSTPSLGGRDITGYTQDLSNAWGIGDAKRNDGLTLLIAPNERQVRIATGLGLEKRLTDADCALVVDRMLVNFRAGDLPGGVVVGAELLDQAVRAKVEPVA